MVGGRVLGRRGGWGKKWDKCNNIINKIYYIYTHTYSSKKRNTAGKKGLARNIQSHERQGPIHPRILYPAKLSFRMEGQRKCFPDKGKLKGISSINGRYKIDRRRIRIV